MHISDWSSDVCSSDLREKKSLGYAAQEVDGEELSQVRQSNFVDALAGKVAGVTVTGSPSGIGGSSRITIRGDKSLNINANQPLFVVDGVPITNDLTGSSGREFQEVDYGNGAGLVKDRKSTRLNSRH